MLTLPGTHAQQDDTGFPADRIDKFVFESWECTARFGRSERAKIILERVFYPTEQLGQLSKLDRKEMPEFFRHGGGMGSVRLNTVRHLSLTKSSGLDLEWWWGESDYEFIFSIEANGTGIYKDLRRSQVARPLRFFDCKKRRLSKQDKETAKIEFLRFLGQNAWRYIENE